MQFKASAPGSLMLLGEYGVLYGKRALVCAVDKRVTVVLTPRQDFRIEIYSSLHGHYATELSQLTIEKPFQFVLGAVKYYQTKLKQGCNIEVTSEFSDRVGLGSSAAVTVATLAAILTWLNVRTSAIELVRLGRLVVRQVQGVGSGADIAAAVQGGMVGYQAQPLLAEKISHTHPLTVLYAGFKTPTVEAIRQVQQHFTQHHDLLRAISHSIGQCAVAGMVAVRKEEWATLGRVMNIQQGLLESLGVNLPVLRAMVEDLRNQPGIVGAKISGSGLGDCVVGLGACRDEYYYAGEQQGVQRIPVAMTLQGVQSEKI